MNPVEVLANLALASIPLLAGMLADGAIAVMDSAHPLKHEKSREKRKAAIQKLFGNSLPDAILQIKSHLNEGFAGCKNAATRSHLIEQCVWKSYHEIQKELNKVQEKYDKCAKLPVNHPRALQEFLECVSANDPMECASQLYKSITQPGYAMSQNRQELLNDLIEVCDIEQFKAWEKSIRLTMSQAFALKMFYHDNRIATCNPADREEYSNLAALDLESMRNYERVLPKKFATKLSELKLRQLLKPKADLLKEHYPKEVERYSCEIGLELEKYLKNEENRSNKQLAQYISEKLQEQYPHFVWAAAVLDNYKDVDLQFSADVYVHRFGSRPADNDPVQGLYRKVMLDGTRLEREDRILYPGKGTYGHFLCYRERNRRSLTERFFKSKAVLAVWIDPDSLSDDATKGMCGKLIDKWENNVHFRESSSGKAGFSTMQVIQDLKDMNMGYAFAVGLHVAPDKNDDGSEKSVGYSQTLLDGFKFPLLLGSVLIWPKELPIAPPAPKDTLVIDESSTELLRIGSRHRIYRSQLMVSGSALSIAIKEIPLTIGSDEQSEQDRCRQTALLDSRMGFQLTQPNLSHDHIVKYFGFSVFTPNPLFNPKMDKLPSYRIVMEFLEGETLSAWVARNPVSLVQIHDWGTDILSALVYIDSKKLVHKDIQGDHIMFEGPCAAGKLKIVSFGRVSEILNDTSLRPGDRNNAFQPDGDVDRGARTDVWSFGCVLIQIITGHPPVLEKRQTGDQNSEKSRKSPKMPDDPGLPVTLLDVLKQCFVLDYYDRPRAQQIMEMPFFANDEYKSCQWKSPVRSSP